MIKVETIELEGAALDWAVAKAVGLAAYTQPDGPVYRPDNGEEWTPTTDWSQAGPLIDEYDVGLVKMEYGDWCAAAYCTEVSAFNDTGPTPLIAAMRAIVATKLGAAVEVPTELAGVRVKP